MMVKTMINLGTDVSSVNGSTNFVDGKHYHFYDRRLTDNPPLLYTTILASADKSIVIWDPHYRNVDVGLFSAICKDNIYLELLTVCETYESKSDMIDFARKVMNAIDVNVVPNCQVKVFALKPKELRGGFWREWHDRYLIIDSKKVYLIGSSLDAQNSSKRSFGIFHLTETADINLVIDSYNAYRNEIIEDRGNNIGNGYKCSVSR